MNKKMDLLKWLFHFIVFIVVFIFILGEFILPKEIKNDTHFELLEASWKMIRQDGICMHSLKSTSLSIGANKLSEHAKALEMAVKEERLDYVQQEHDSFLKEYQEFLQKIKKGLASL